MKYYIGILCKGDFKEYYDRVVDEISNEFGLLRLAEKGRIPHITLKSPFETENISEIEKIVNSLSDETNTSRFLINGLKGFKDNVLYFRVNPSIEMRESFESLLIRLARVARLDKYDSVDKEFHITLAKGQEMEGKYNEILNYLLRKTTKFDLLFDNITIFQKDESITRVHKTYSMKI